MEGPYSNLEIHSSSMITPSVTLYVGRCGSELGLQKQVTQQSWMTLYLSSIHRLTSRYRATI